MRRGELTPEQTERAHELSRRGMGVREICKAISSTRARVERAIYPDRYERKKASARAYFRKWRANNKSWISPFNRESAPAHVLEERDRAYSVPQGFFGEPPLGRSALERKQTA